MFKRFLLAIFLLPLSLLAYISPGQPTGHINDFAGLLSPQVRSELETQLADLKTQTGSEVAVVTIPSLGNDETIETYAEKLFQEWGIGKEKEDNGLLLLISRDDRKIRIEIGYGLEPVITDIESAHIISDLISPAFKAGDYDKGTTQAIARISQDIQVGSPPEVKSHDVPFAPFLGQFLYITIFFFIWVVSILARSKSWWAGGVIGALLGWIIFSGIISIVLLTGIGLIIDYIVSKKYRESMNTGLTPPWWIGGGGSGRSGGGGGFGGFGGGSSGGGGASGSW